MDQTKCYHRWQTQEGETKFTWPQVYQRSFLRPNPQVSCIRKNPRHEDRRWSPLPLLWWDICKRGQQAVQELEKPGKLHTQNLMIGKDNHTTNFSTIAWMNFQTGSDYPIEIWKVSNPNFSPTIWMNFQTGFDYPIEIWQVSNANFSPTVWMNF